MKRRAAEATKNTMARKILKILICLISEVSAFALLFLLLAEHLLLLALHLLEARHEA